MQVPMTICIITVVAIAGCGEPIDTSGLSGQEASLAAEGSADMREQDGTMGDQTLDTLSGAGAPDPFNPDPFITRERIDRTSTLDESNVAPGASTLEPGAESLTGDPMDQPAVNVQDE